MSKLHNMRGIEIPKFRAVSSGAHTLNELFGSGNSFSNAWVSAHKHLLRTHLYEPQYFLWHEDGDVNRSVWALATNDGVTAEDIAPYELIEFPGGIFLVAADESDSDDLNETVNCMMTWIQNSPNGGTCTLIWCTLTIEYRNIEYDKHRSERDDHRGRGSMLPQASGSVVKWDAAIIRQAVTRTAQLSFFTKGVNL